MQQRIKCRSEASGLHESYRSHHQSILPRAILASNKRQQCQYCQHRSSHLAPAFSALLLAASTLSTPHCCLWSTDPHDVSTSILASPAVSFSLTLMQIRMIFKRRCSRGQTILRARKPRLRRSISGYVEIYADDILRVAGPAQPIPCMPRGFRMSTVA
jgi:hypothetical protein